MDVAIAKFSDHLPLERQVRQMARDGLAVDSSTLWEQHWFLSRHLLPTYEANHAHVLASEVIAVSTSLEVSTPPEILDPRRRSRSW